MRLPAAVGVQLDGLRASELFSPSREHVRQRFDLAPIPEIPAWPGIGPVLICGDLMVGLRPRMARAGDGDGR